MSNFGCKFMDLELVTFFFRLNIITYLSQFSVSTILYTVVCRRGHSRQMRCQKEKRLKIKENTG